MAQAKDIFPIFCYKITRRAIFNCKNSNKKESGRRALSGKKVLMCFKFQYHDLKLLQT